MLRNSQLLFKSKLKSFKPWIQFKKLSYQSNINSNHSSFNYKKIIVYTTLTCSFAKYYYDNVFGPPISPFSTVEIEEQLKSAQKLAIENNHKENLTILIKTLMELEDLKVNPLSEEYLSIIAQIARSLSFFGYTEEALNVYKESLNLIYDYLNKNDILFDYKTSLIIDKYLLLLTKYGYCYIDTSKDKTSPVKLDAKQLLTELFKHYLIIRNYILNRIKSSNLQIINDNEFNHPKSENDINYKLFNLILINIQNFINSNFIVLNQLQSEKITTKLILISDDFGQYYYNKKSNFIFGNFLNSNNFFKDLIQYLMLLNSFDFNDCSEINKLFLMESLYEGSQLEKFLRIYNNNISLEILGFFQNSKKLIENDNNPLIALYLNLNGVLNYFEPSLNDINKIDNLELPNIKENFKDVDNKIIFEIVRLLMNKGFIQFMAQDYKNSKLVFAKCLKLSRKYNFKMLEKLSNENLELIKNDYNNMILKKMKRSSNNSEIVLHYELIPEGFTK